MTECSEEIDKEGLDVDLVFWWVHFEVCKIQLSWIRDKEEICRTKNMVKRVLDKVIYEREEERG